MGIIRSDRLPYGLLPGNSNKFRRLGYSKLAAGDHSGGTMNLITLQGLTLPPGFHSQNSVK